MSAVFQIELGRYAQRLNDAGKLRTLLNIIEECKVTPTNYACVAPRIRDLLDPTVSSFNEELFRKVIGLNNTVTPRDWDLTVNFGEKRLTRFRTLQARWDKTRTGLLGNLVQHSEETAAILDWEPEDDRTDICTNRCMTLRCKSETTQDRLGIEMGRLNARFAGLDYFIAFLLDYTMKLRTYKYDSFLLRNLFITRPEFIDGEWCKDLVELVWVSHFEFKLMRRSSGVGLSDLLKRADLLAIEHR